MADEKDPKSPATTSCAYDLMAPRWKLVDDLLGGTETMRAAGSEHLPRHSEETEEAYQCRLATTTLFNVFEQTLNTLSSKPFSEEVKLNDDVPKALLPLLDDVDLQGNKLAVFIREWFRIGLSKALCHVLVELPRLEPKADGSPRTKADDLKDNVRPYAVLIRPENVLYMEEATINGVRVLTHVRILECYTERVGFAEVHRQRIRVLDPGIVSIWEPAEKKIGQKEQWVPRESYPTGYDFIPLVTFYSNSHESPGLAKPPLLDLAHLNVSHWQSTSEQRHALTVARFPILACSGASGDDSDAIVVGPNKVLYNEDPQGKFYFVEHTGAAIEAGRLDLEDLEERMANYGAEFLKDRPGDPTATAKAIDSAESGSDLAAIVGVFEDAVAQVLEMMVEVGKLSAATEAVANEGGEPNEDGPKGGTIELVKAYTPDLADAPGLTSLQAARAAKDLSRENFLRGLVLRGVLPEDFDLAENDEELQDEQDTLMALGASMGNLDPLGNPLPEPKPEPGAPAPAPKPGTKAPAAPAPAPKKPAAKQPAAKKVAK